MTTSIRVIEKSIENYASKVKTGQDLIDLGVVPKTSSEHLALIFAKRLEALRDSIKANINDDMLGKWIPAISPKMKDLGKTEVEDPSQIEKYAETGMKVRIREHSIDKTLVGRIGIIDEFYKDSLRMTLEQQDGPSNRTPQLNTSISQLTLLIPSGKVQEGLELTRGVVADKKIGHLVRFSQEYQGTAWDSGGYEEKIDLVTGTSGTLIDFLIKEKRLGINFNEKVPPGKKKNIYYFKLRDMEKRLEASSLGQFEPRDKEQTIYEETLERFFPSTIIDTKRAERVLLSTLIGKDIVLYGPPGSGKTNIAEDIKSIAELQGPIFIVEGCQSQCSPFSLFDKDFAKTIPPCPECKIKYCPDFKKTGRFVHPKPKEVKVIVAKYNEGFGIEHIDGTIGLQVYHFTGHKMPRLDGTTTVGRESAYDPEGYQAGLLPRTNNGILHIDEMSCLRPQVLDCILGVLQNNRTKPDQLRFSYPAHSFIIGTANDHTQFSPALNDRMNLLAIRYPEGRTGIDKRHKITRVAFHKEYVPAEFVDIGDTHLIRADVITSVPMPVPIERAVDAFYMKFDLEYPLTDAENNPTGKNEISSGNRSKLDALLLSRAILWKNRKFYSKTPRIVTADYAIPGIQFALCSRVQISAREKEQNAKEKLISYVRDNFPTILKQEEDNWWCNTIRHIAIAKTQVSEIEENFLEELKKYQADSNKENPTFLYDSFNRVQRAVSPAANDLEKKALLEFPLMNLLFTHPEYKQSRMNNITQPQLKELITYLIKCYETSSCKIQ